MLVKRWHGREHKSLSLQSDRPDFLPILAQLLTGPGVGKLLTLKAFSQLPKVGTDPTSFRVVVRMRRVNTHGSLGWPSQPTLSSQMFLCNCGKEPLAFPQCFMAYRVFFTHYVIYAVDKVKVPLARILIWPWLASSLHTCGQYVGTDSIKRALPSAPVTQWHSCKSAGEQR